MNDTPTLSRDYRIVRVLGQGGMGVVYEAEHGPLGRRVALKVLSEESNTDPTALARLRREALSMGALQHPHIVQVSEFSEGPPPFLVMDLLSGQSLRDRLVPRGPMRPALLRVSPPTRAMASTSRLVTTRGSRRRDSS